MENLVFDMDFMCFRQATSSQMPFKDRMRSIRSTLVGDSPISPAARARLGRLSVRNEDFRVKGGDYHHLIVYIMFYF